LSWGTDHGEEAVYVASGDAPWRAAIVEAGVPGTLAVNGDVIVLAHRGGATSGGSTVHLVGDDGTWAKVEPGRATRYYADSECPTCDVTLFVTGRDGAHESAPHSHSADELIHVLDGSITLGAHVVGPGQTVAIAAGQRYGFRSDGFRFLNYRPTVATMTRDGVTIEEGPRAHGFERVA
jgi:mannose-6-phosphate isomerase-like protein (cupin superfamily)